MRTGAYLSAEAPAMPLITVHAAAAVNLPVAHWLNVQFWPARLDMTSSPLGRMLRARGHSSYALYTRRGWAKVIPSKPACLFSIRSPIALITVHAAAALTMYIKRHKSKSLH